MKRLLGRTDGFTLAEVLITLAIIGVIAALTIPTLINTYQKKVYETGFAKLYSTVTNGFKAYNAKNYCAILRCSKVNDYIIDAVINQDYENSDNMFNETFKVSKILKGTEVADAFGEYYNFSGDDTGLLKDNNYAYAVIFSDGSALLSPFGYLALFVILDSNGTKGPNKFGYDAFLFLMPDSHDITLIGPDRNPNYPHIMIPYGGQKGTLAGDWKEDNSMCGKPNEKITSSDNVTYGYGCAARIIDEGFKINYF